MRCILLSLFLVVFLGVQAQNLLSNSGFETYTAGTSSYMTTGNGNATGSSGSWQLAFVGNNFPTCSGASCGTTVIDNTTANTGANSLKINITKQTNRNDIRLFQSITSVPSGNNFVVKLYVKSDIAGYPFTVNVFKSTEAINSNGTCTVASPCASFTTTTGWKQYKMYVDLSTWTTVELSNMRISIRPNTTTATPTGPYPKVFWFDDITFQVVDPLVEMKDVAIEVATQRMQLAIDSGFTAEANAIAADIVTLNNSTPTTPFVPVKAVGFNPAPSYTTAATNPFIAALHSWAANYLTKTFTSFPKSTKGNYVFPNSYDARTLAETVENLHWLIVSPYSNYRYNVELFRRLLTILYATTEDYKINGKEASAIPGSTTNAMNDWFAACNMSNAWRMADTSFSNYIIPTFKQIIKDAADSMGTQFNGYAQSINTYQYTNRDISYAEVLMHLGVMRNNATWVAMSKRLVDSINLVARLPDGAYLYYKKQNEVTNYHGGTTSSLSRIWAVSEYQPAGDCISKTAMFEIFSIEGNNNPEFNTAPAWKTMWNGSSGFSPEAILYFTQNKYLKARYNKIRQNAGYVDDMPSSVAFYNASIPTAYSLPNNYVCYDRNTQGVRGRYNNFSYTTTTRNAAIPITEPGLQTVVGAMQGYIGANGKDSLDAALMSVHSKVHVRKTSGEEHNEWGYMLANNTSPKTTVSKVASTVSISGGLQYETAGPTGTLTNWSSYQQWITLPDRIIGVVETYPTNNAATLAYEIDGRVRFTYGRAISTPKYLITDVAGSRYSYGKFKAIIHAHDFTTVTTDTAGVVLSDFRNSMEIIFRYNLSNGNALFSYPANTKKYFIVEIRDSSAVGDAIVLRDQSVSGIKGLVVKLNGKAYASYRNDNASPTSVNLATSIMPNAINEVHFSRGDSLINLPQVITSSSFNIPASEQILLISTTSPLTDTGKAWQNYAELLSKTDTFSTVQSGNWSSAATWNYNALPATNNNVLVSNDVTVDNARQVNTLTIAAGKTITIANGQTLTVTGGLINNGTITGAGKLIVTSALVSGNGTINNVDVNSNAGISISGNLVLKGLLQPLNGVINTNNRLVLFSDANNTASIGVGSGSYINGNVTVQRFINPRRAFRFLGHPFSNGIALTQLTQNIDITGGGGSSALGFTPTGSNSASALWFNTSNGNNAVMDAGWVAFTDLTQTTGNNGWNKYKGINVLVRGAKTEGLNGLAYTPSSVTLSLTGTVNTGTQTVPIDNTNTGWNLIANPYPSSINLQNVLTRSGISNGVYVWNALAALRGAYQPVPANSNYILPSGSAFMVKSTGANQNLVFNESDKITETATTLLGTKKGMQIDVMLDSIIYDRLFIVNKDNATAFKDVYDLEKIPNSNVNFSALSADSFRLSINALPFNTLTNIPLSFTATDTLNYAFNFKNVLLPDGRVYYLHDKHKKIYQPISDGLQYVFNASVKDSSNYVTRFEITIAPQNRVIPPNSNVAMAILNEPSKWMVNYNNPISGAAFIKLVDVYGKQWMVIDISNQQAGQVNVPKSALPQGVYFIQLQTNNDIITKKVIK